MCAYNPYYYHPPYPYYYYPPPYHYPGVPPSQYPCTRCNTPMVFLPMYQEWFCPRCQKYASELYDQAEDKRAEGGQELITRGQRRPKDRPAMDTARKGTLREKKREYHPPKIRKCIICNTENMPGETYCRKCGHHLFRCRSCGSKNESGSTTCASCGNQLD